MGAGEPDSAAADPRLPPRLSVAIRRRPGVVSLKVQGELDLAAARSFRAAIYPHAASGEVVELDLSALGFLDSSGLQLLISAYKSARADGWTLRIVPPLGPARQALGIAGMERVLPLV